MSGVQAGDGGCCVLNNCDGGDHNGDGGDGVFYDADDDGSSHLVAKDAGEDGDVVGLIEHFLR